MTAYCSTSDLRDALGIASGYENTLSAAADAATTAINVACGGRHFTQDASATPRILRPLSCELCPTPDISTTTGLVVATDDGTGTYPNVWAASDYLGLPYDGVGSDGMTGWPFEALEAVGTRYFAPRSLRTRRPTVQVTAKWGWAAVPANITLAARLVALDLWHRREIRVGLIGGEALAYAAKQAIRAHAGLLDGYVRDGGIVFA